MTTATDAHRPIVAPEGVELRRRSVELPERSTGTTVSLLEGRPVDGDGGQTAVVPLHGGGVDAATFSWRHVLPALAAKRRVLAVDLPGHGHTDRVPGVAGTADYVDVVAAFLDAVDVRGPSLVGVSMGGAIAIGVALDRPDRVDGPVAIDSYGLGGAAPGGRLAYLFVRLPLLSAATRTLSARSPAASRLALRAVTHPENRSPELFADFRRCLDRSDAGATFRAFQRAEVGPTGLRTNYLDRLPDLAVPTLFLHGETDPVVPDEWAVRAAGWSRTPGSGCRRTVDTCPLANARRRRSTPSRAI